MLIELISDIHKSQFFSPIPNAFLKLSSAGNSLVNSSVNQSFAYDMANGKRINIILITVIVILSLVIIAGSVFLARHYRIAHERLENERRLTELQFVVLRNQLDPHFVFNTLNAIGSSIYQNDKEESYDFLQRFSTFIRSSLIHADKSYRTLKEELEFVRNYLELEKFRFENKFDYAVHMQDGINQDSVVPKMIIHTFAESAVKHGLVQKSGKGLLTVNMNMEQDFLNIAIDDNGVGRVNSLEFNNSSSKNGIEIMMEFVSFFNRFNEKKIHFEIEDIIDNSKNVAGTHVNIKLPTDFTYKSIT